MGGRGTQHHDIHTQAYTVIRYDTCMRPDGFRKLEEDLCGTILALNHRFIGTDGACGGSRLLGTNRGGASGHESWRGHGSRSLRNWNRRLAFIARVRLACFRVPLKNFVVAAISETVEVQSAMLFSHTILGIPSRVSQHFSRLSHVSLSYLKSSASLQMSTRERNFQDF